MSLRLWCAHCLACLDTENTLDEFRCPHCGADHIARTDYLDEKQYAERRESDDQMERDARASGLIL